MDRTDAQEANQIVQSVLKNLLVCIPQYGTPGVTARTAIGSLIANALDLLLEDAIGPPLQNCFDLVVAAGATLAALDNNVRVPLEAMTPATLGGTLLQNASIQFCLCAEADVISGMTFTSRQDVDLVLEQIQQPFADAEETAADEMAQATYQALVALQAAVTNFLVTTAQPLPRLVSYQFAKVLPTLVIAYRLYQDASRADQIRAENKIIHPAFCPPTGQALSS